MAFPFEPLLAVFAGHIMAVLAGPEHGYGGQAMSWGSGLSGICAKAMRRLWPGLEKDFQG